MRLIFFLFPYFLEFFSYDFSLIFEDKAALLECPPCHHTLSTFRVFHNHEVSISLALTPITQSMRHDVNRGCAGVVLI